MADYDAISEALQKGKAPEVKEMVQKAVDEGAPAGDILDKGLIAGMSIIGAKFKANEVYVPEVLIAARAMHAGMEILEPEIVKAGIEPKGSVIIGTVKGDLHDIGKNLVTMMFKGAGFKVIDIGIDVPAEKFVEAAKAESIKLIGCSALLTTTMPQMKEVVDAVKAAGLDTKVLIGGAPVTQSYCDEIGADGYAPDASSAVDVAKELLSIN